VNQRDVSNLLLFALAKMHKHYDDSNPDVGFPPDPETLLERAIKGTEITEADVDYQNVLLRFKAWYNQERSQR
jgi:hypothetical protein